MNQDNEKLYIYTAVIVLVAALIFVIVLIWKPSSNDIKRGINYIGDVTEYKELQSKNYKKIIEKMLMVNNYDELYEKIDKEWLEENAYTKDNLYDSLVEKGIISNYVPNIKDVTVVNCQEGTYYRFQIQNMQGNIRYIVVNETSSNDYTISFEQKSISNIEGKIYTYVEDGVTYTLKVKAVFENVVQYELNIASLREDTITYDFGNYQNVLLCLTTGEKIVPSDITATANNIYEVGQNSNITIDLTFNLLLEKNNNLEKIQLFNVLDRDGNKTINIDLLGGEK